MACSFRLLIASLTLAAVTWSYPSAADDKPRYGGTLVSVLPDDPPTLATWTSASFLPRMVTPQIVEGLVSHAPDLSPKPGLATEWSVSPDGLVYTFRLREGVRWHDGVPFTADDVVFSVNEVWLKHLGAARSRWEPVGVTAEKLDDHTVRLRLKRPYVYALTYMAAYTAPIIPKHLFENGDFESNPYNERPIGTGAFKFEGYTRGSHITLVRNPDYWGRDEDGNKLPYLNRVIFRIMPDVTARTMAASKHEIDYQNFPGFPVETVEALKGMKYKVAAEQVAGIARVQRVFINGRSGPLSKVEVRKALYSAIDRETLLQKAGYGFGKVSISPLNAGSAAYSEYIVGDVNQYPFDIDRANRMLDAAGFPKGADGTRFKLRMVISRGLSSDESISELMRDTFAKVGVSLEIQKVDEATRLALVGKRDFDLSMLGGTVSGPTPDSPNYFWISSLRDVPGGWNNPSGIADPQIDAYLRQGAEELDPVKRNQIWRDFQSRMMNMAYEWYLFDVPVVSAWNPDFVGLPQKVWGHYDSFERIWWRKGKATP
jgi:peptide/nickel transport system substrate-binding protein